MISEEINKRECAEMADRLRTTMTDILQDKHLISGKVAIVAVLAKMILETTDPARAMIFVLDMLHTAIQEGQRCLAKENT